MTSRGSAIAALAALSPAQCVQALFVLAASFVLAIAVAPAAERGLLLNYGARRDHDVAGPVNTTKNGSPTAGTTSREQQEDTRVQAVVRKLTSLGQVPHSWFFTYYAFYLICAGAWAAQYYFLEAPHSLLGFLANRQVALTPDDAPTMAGGQVVVLWVLMLLQAGRRLYECFAVMKPSKSTMWFVHWGIGLGYYLGVSVAIWIEGSAALLHNRLLSEFSADTQLKTSIALPLFFYGWVMQHRCHKHLAGLKKYSLPDAGLFEYLICPHYTCECLMYLSLALIGAPAGQWCNRTLLSVLIFVAVNLGVTAHGTRNWYGEKFGAERLAGKWTMIPLVY